MQQNQNKFAHFGIQQGYAIHGDFALLNAELALPTESSDWSLQLWACDAPAATAEVDGVMVAEAPVDVAAIDADGRGIVNTRVPARLPVSGRDYAMVMALARRDADGLSHIHAVSNFDNRQWVEGPCLQGAVGYAIDGENINLSVDAVHNPRQGNVSGTLALELWAFSAPYDGRSHKDGQHVGAWNSLVWRDITSHLGVSGTTPFHPPQGGRWHMALLLREWTAMGYVTRDFRTFDVVYERAAEVVAAPAAVEPVAVAVSSVAAKPVAVPAPAHVAAPAPVVAKAAVAVAVPASAPAPVAPKAPVAVKDVRVSVQTASVDELASVPGLNKKIAQEIVRSRPFKSLDDLAAVRGIGDKTLRKLRSSLKV